MCVHEPHAKFLIFGDFNMGSSIEWIIFENECDPISRCGDIANELVDTLAVNDLKQINYIRNEINSRILDLVLTNTDNFTLSPAPELSVIDKFHPPFMVAFTKDVKFITPKKMPKLNYFKANYELINYELERIDWGGVLSVLPDVNSQVDTFYDIINDVIKRYAPLI